MALVVRSVFQRSIVLTLISSGFAVDPIPPEDLIFKLALEAKISATPSACAVMPPALITKSPAKLVRTWPRVISPAASRLSLPAPASTKVSSAIVMAPMPASSVISPPLLPRSPCSDRVRPAAPARVMAPPPDVNAARMSRTPLLARKLMSLLVASIAACRVVAPPATTVTAALPVL